MVPSVSTLYSTSSGRAVHAPLYAAARRLTDLCTAHALSANCERRVCASHPHGSGAVFSIRRARSGVAELQKSAEVAELRKSSRVAELNNSKPEQLSSEAELKNNELESPNSESSAVEPPRSGDSAL